MAKIPQTFNLTFTVDGYYIRINDQSCSYGSVLQTALAPGTPGSNPGKTLQCF